MLTPALRRAVTRRRPAWVIRGKVADVALQVGSVPAGQAATPRQAVAWFREHRRVGVHPSALRAFPRIP